MFFHFFLLQRDNFCIFYGEILIRFLRKQFYKKKSNVYDLYFKYTTLGLSLYLVYMIQHVFLLWLQSDKIIKVNYYKIKSLIKLRY